MKRTRYGCCPPKKKKCKRPSAKQEAGTGHAAAWAVDSHGAPAAAKRLDRFAVRLDHRLRDPAAARVGALSLAEEKGLSP